MVEVVQATEVGPEAALLILGFRSEEARLEAERLLEEAGMARWAINRLKNEDRGWSYLPTPNQGLAADLLRWALYGGCPFGIDRAAQVLTLLGERHLPMIVGRHNNTCARATWREWEKLALA